MHGFQKIQLDLQFHQEITQINNRQSNSSLICQAQSEKREGRKKKRPETNLIKSIIKKEVSLCGEAKGKGDAFIAADVSPACVWGVAGAPE